MFWKGTYPRGIRQAFSHFDIPGLETAVQIDGTLNDNGDIDKGWSVAITIPRRSLELLATGRTPPPTTGDVWALFLGRFQKLRVGSLEVQPHPAMSLTPQGMCDTIYRTIGAELSF